MIDLIAGANIKLIIYFASNFWKKKFFWKIKFYWEIIIYFKKNNLLQYEK